MTHVDFDQVELENIITHHIGNRQLEGDLQLSDALSTFSPDTESYLLRYFILPFKTEEFFNLTHSVQLNMNEVYMLAGQIFDAPDTLVAASQNIAKLLYEHSTHPKIKDGECNVAFLKNIVIDNEVVDAIGIFKSETESPFLQMEKKSANFDIQHHYGFELKNMDKGCIIFNVEKEKGYKLLIIDHANKGSEALYWKDDFLQVKPVSDEFQHTNQFLNITKNYITQKMTEDFDVSRTDQIDLLNRSVEYFKTHERFEKEDFEEEVLQQEDIIKSFKSFDKVYREEHEIEEEMDEFEISAQAVKKQARVFKSVLKLDKNFHIYIHGNKNLIEQGTEDDGRKFYKIYYREEN